MKPRTFVTCFATLLVATLGAHAATPSPYAGQQSRGIKSLSESDQADLLAGKGMGLAKAAELNGYPGPAHVLELAAELQMTDEQRAATQRLFDSMQARARELGRELVTAEQALDALFASRQITPAQLGTSLARIGELQAQVRAAHLQAHLEQVRVLSPEQTARYNVLRGYGPADAQAGHHGRHKH